MRRITELNAFYAVLALDEVREVYPYVGISEYGDNIQDIFKRCVMQANFSDAPWSVHAVYNAFKKMDIEPSLRTFLNGWSDDIYFHISSFQDRSISEWMDIFIQTKYRASEFVTLTETKLHMITSVIDDIDQLEKNDGFMEIVTEIKDRFDLSEWDIQLHTFYKYNYFGELPDVFGPKDPFLYVNGVRKGRIFLNYLRTSPLIRDPEFPYKELIEAKARYNAKWGIMAEPGYQLVDLRELAGKRVHVGV